MHKLYLYQKVKEKFTKKNSLNLMTGFAFFLPISAAVADVYKCISTDQATQKSKIVYTDAPCDKSAKQKTVDVSDPVKAPAKKTAVGNAESQDDQFNRAILDRDFKKAKALANTKEQWRLIALAEDKSEAKTDVKSPAQLSLEGANQQIIAQNASQDQACEQARNDYDVTSRNQWRERDLVAAKKSIMLAACGTAEAPSQPYIVNSVPYNGIRSYSTPIYPNVYPYGYGWGQHYPHSHNGDGYTEHTGSGQTSGGSVSLRYNSKNFGVNAQSFGVQSESSTTNFIGNSVGTHAPSQSFSTKDSGTQNSGTKIFNPATANESR